ncbi:hypothetical protein RGQ29_032386 [Quercus rubra]|uniref:Uncharacterized protein n=1 Tax=Quercus rubra TaxID=3512 RepID=A0AAN7I6F1_QUERU|nr:hypothetical protein RGQ29_032386 [Quercus rubra]
MSRREYWIGLAIVQHVPELQVDYWNLLKTIYSEPTEAKNKLGCKIRTLFKTAIVRQVKNSVNHSKFLRTWEHLTRQLTRLELAY